MKNRIIYGVLVTVLSLNLLAGFQVYEYSAGAEGKEDPYQSLTLFTQVMEMIRQDYVDSDKVSYDQLVNAALKGMVATLDPHSEYLTPKKYGSLQDDTRGDFGGIGIVVGMRNDRVTVISPMEGTPGYRAGIQPGDAIIKINGRPTDGFSTSDAAALLRGKAGTAVNITLYRASEPEPIEVSVERARIKVATVKDINGSSLENKEAFKIDEDKIGYVKLVQFGENTADDLKKAMERLERQGMKSMVLDLRGNPGGLLDQAIEVCQLFIPRGELVLTTEGRRSSQKARYLSRGRDEYVDLRLAILVNGYSASASEIVAGCLQDATAEGTCDAILVGETTFGKGSVQSILPLEGGAALRLTTAKYYTPSHRVIHERGIDPDIEVKMTDEQEQALYARGMLGGIDSITDKEKRDALKKSRDVQLDRAVDMLKGISLLMERAPVESEKVAAKN